jgi:hypothetical protein
MITHNLDAKHTVELAEVSNLNMAAEFGLELLNKMHGAGGDGAVINVHSNNDKLLDLRQELVENGLIYSRLIIAQGNKD